MKHKTAVERLKEHENDIIIKSQIRGFTVTITDNKDNTGTIAIWLQGKDTTTATETLDIRGVANFQIDIKKNNEVLERGLSITHLTQWIYNRLNYANIEFMYQFQGGNYSGITMNRADIERISNGTTEDLTDIRRNGGTCHRKELDNQPLVNGYLSPMYSHMDYGLIYLRYETQEIYDMMSN